MWLSYFGYYGYLNFNKDPNILPNHSIEILELNQRGNIFSCNSRGE